MVQIMRIHASFMLYTFICIICMLYRQERPPAAIRCHCPGCRRFHASAFGAFVAAEVEKQ